MISDNSFSFVYEDDDDCINAKKSNKRGHSYNPVFEFNVPNLNTNNNIINIKENDKFVENKKRKIDDLNNSNHCNQYCKKFKYNQHIIVPNIIMKQVHLTKFNLNNIINELKVIKLIKPNSKIPLSINKDYLDLFNNSYQIPTLLFLFDYSTLSYLRNFEAFKDKNINIIGITPNYDYFNEQSYPIIIDNNGEFIKNLNMRDPLGGGIYPIPSIFLFNSSNEEVLRIKLGYDYNIYYDSTVQGNLQNVLLQCINYVCKS